jgi:hypothetical protein
MKENQALRDVNHQKQIAEMEADRAVIAQNETMPMSAQISNTFFSAPAAASSVVVSNSYLELSAIEQGNSEALSSLNLASSLAEGKDAVICKGSRDTDG